MSNVRSSEEATAVTDERAELIDCLRYRPVATTAAQMSEAADLLERDGARIAELEAENARIISGIYYQEMRVERDEARKALAEARRAEGEEMTIKIKAPRSLNSSRLAEQSRDAYAARLCTADELLRAFVVSGIEHETRMYGLMQVDRNDLENARAYLAAREKER